MKTKISRQLILAVALAALCCVPAIAQKKKPASTAPRPIIFAVLSDGSTLEPIATVVGGKLIAPVNGGDEQAKIVAFDKSYYKAGTSYRLIFGGANAGTVKVKSSDPTADCSRNMGDVTTTSASAKLKGLVMGLATNVTGKTAATVFRRKPTAREKAEIETLVRAEFQKQKITPKELRYQNLTAIDIDRDGNAEFVGSYWTEVNATTRALLFFVAEQGAGGKYSLAFKEFRTIDQTDVMSGDIKDIDQGVYHELLLDSFDYNGDGTAEIFTYTQSFEGTNFTVYNRAGGKWVKGYEFSNYHCGY